MRSLRGVWGAAVIAVMTAIVASNTTANAAAPVAAFSLKVSPSPLVQTVKPGIASTIPMQIRNNGTTAENLKIEVRKFTYNSKTGGVSIDDVAAPDLSQWITFASQKFSVAPGQTYTEDVTIQLPAQSGFSYSFVLVISRQEQAQATGGGRLLEGSVADFGLVNVDRPGATKSLQITSLKMSAGVYEYVPATLSLTFKNTGNTFIQPLGNIFIGRGDAGSPISTLNLTDTGGYILPGTTRTVTAQWNDGFPRIDTHTLSDGTTTSHEVWDWADIGKFRIGLYTARVVAVYNNGSYDIPLNAEVQFWILPWKIILGILVILLVIGFGVFTVIRAILRSAAGGPRGGFRR